MLSVVDPSATLESSDVTIPSEPAETSEPESDLPGPIGEVTLPEEATSPFTPLPPPVALDAAGREYVLGDGFVLEPVGVSSPSSSPGGGFELAIELDRDGVGALNAMAADCLQGSERCPTGLGAFVSEGRVVAAPMFQSAGFTDSVSVTGGDDDKELRELEAILNAPSLREMGLVDFED